MLLTSVIIFEGVCTCSFLHGLLVHMRNASEFETFAKKVLTRVLTLKSRKKLGKFQHWAKKLSYKKRVLHL